jgi:hypothetical protein
MITIFCDFRQFSAKKLAFFSKANAMIKILHNLAKFLVKNAYFFAEIFGEKIITSVPGHLANGRDLQDVLEPCQPDVGDDGAAEEVDEEALGALHLRVVVEARSGEEEAGLGAGRDLVVGKLLQALEFPDAELDHVEHVVVEHSANDLK